MALPPVFPLYPESLNGPYHVSLAFPGPQSEILKSAGKTASSLLLVPQAEFLEKFIQGDLGIGDSVLKGMIAQNFSAPQATKDEKVFRNFAKLAKIDIEDINKYKKGDKFVMPTSEIKISPEFDNIGLKSIEKTTLKSIFETQKPYIEVAKLVIENLAYIEDIIARVMPLVSVNPLTCKSEKPNSNSGKDKRPKAMGFNNGDDLKKELSKIETILNDIKPIQKLKLDLGVVDEYFRINSTDEKRKSASKSERTLLSKYSILINLLQKPTNIFEFVYSEIVKSSGSEVAYKSAIQKFLDDESKQTKGLKIYKTNQPIDDVGLNLKDIKEILDAAENKYRFRNNQNIANVVWLQIFTETALKFFREKVPYSMIPDESSGDPNQSENPGKWKVINTIYSTGEFNPDVDYLYKYIDLPTDEIKFKEKKSELDLSSTDPFHKYKPKKMIFGIYDSQGKPLNPIEPVKTIGLNGTNVVQVDTPFKKADWILRSPKWNLPTGVFQWPVYAEPTYVWEKGNQKRESKNNPDATADPAWKIKKYKEGDKDLISKEDAFPGNPVIAKIDLNEQLEYRNFFDEYLKFSFHKTENLTKKAKIDSRLDIISRLDVQAHVQNVFNFGQIKSSFYKRVNEKDPVPVFLKKSFKPYQLFSTKAAVDKEIRDFYIEENIEPGFIWIEPEADYDMKLIRIDPVSKISYKGEQPESELNTSIREFVKNRFTIKFSNDIPFTIEVRKNSTSLVEGNPFSMSDPEVITNITSYSVENWNYDKAKVFNNNFIDFTIYSSVAPPIYRTEDKLIIKAEGEINSFYELLKTGDSYYYRKFKFAVDLADVIIQAFLGWVSPSLLYTLWVLYLSDPNAEYTFSVLDISYTIQLKNLFPYKEYEYFTAGDIVLFTDGGINSAVVDDAKKRVVRLDGNGKITRWYYLKDKRFTGPSNKIPSGQTVTIDREEKTNEVLPTFGVVRNFIIDPNTNSTKELKDHTITYTDQDFTLYKLRVEDTDPFGKIIDPSKITNNQLTVSEIFGYGKDGLLSKYGHGSQEEPQELLVIPRYRLTDLDTESYFIIEGTLRNPPKDELDVPDRDKQNNPAEANYYRLPDALGAIKVFLSMLANVFAKLIPAIQKLIALFKNPLSFVTDIVSEKLGESVGFLNKESLKSFQEGAEKSIDIRDTLDPQEKKQKVRDLKKFFKDSPLSNYVFVKDDGRPASILDGSGTIPFSMFGQNLNFGMKLDLGELVDKKPPLKLIFEKDLSLKNMKNLQSELSLRKFDTKQPSLKQSSNKNENLTSDYEVKFEDGTKKTIQPDSFNQFVVDNSKRYNFVYVDEGVGKTINKVDELTNSGSQEDLQRAKELLDKAKKESPNDDSLLQKEQELKDKLEELKANQQPMLKFVLGIVTLPIKIIAGIIEWIMNFFKSLINPVTLPSKIIELVSFQWIMQFFTPKGILEIAGIRFKPEKKAEWAVQANIPGPPTTQLPKSLKLPEDIKLKGFDFKSIKAGEYLSPDDFKLVDLSEFLNVGFHLKLPKYSAMQFRQNLKLPGPLLSAPGGGGFLCLIEKIINGIIDFVWATLGIEALIPPPHIKLCDQKKPEDAAKIKDNTAGPTQSQALDGFYYEVQLENGKTLKFLNQDELQQFIDNNKDFNYDFNF